MSDRKQQMRTRGESSSTPPILGVMLQVDGKLVGDTFPLSQRARQRLLAAVLQSAERYRAGGLPPKIFSYLFETSRLLVLFSRRTMVIVWMSQEANLVELEIAARKLVSIAHLSGSTQPGNPILAALAIRPPATPAPEKPAAAVLDLEIIPAQSIHMTWTEATLSLENIMSKVLTHAQTARLITSAIQRKGIDVSCPADAASVAEIGADLAQKIPSRPIRASLEKEIAALVATIH